MSDVWNDVYNNKILNDIDKGFVFEIDKDYRLYICVINRNHDYEKFIKCFKDVWLNIPKQQKEKMFGLWSNQAMGYCSISFLNLWRDSAVSHAQTRNNGNEMEFNSETISSMTDGGCRFIIAHELGHVMQRANGLRPFEDPNGIPFEVSQLLRKVSYRDADGNFWGYTEDIEFDADRWARAWGEKRETVLPDQYNEDLILYEFTMSLHYQAGIIGVKEEDSKDVYGYIDQIPVLELINICDSAQLVKDFKCNRCDG